MSSSYSSLDWVLSHWAHFTVRRFLCLCLFLRCVALLHMSYYCNTVGNRDITRDNHIGNLVRLKPNPCTSSFSALTLLVGSFDPYKPVADMTYNVFSGTLNLTQSINHIGNIQLHIGAI